MQTKHESTPSRAIRLEEVVHLTGASRPTIWRWSRNDPTFPKPFKLSDAITCWDASEISQWLQQKKAERT
jgi:prophage regulatory protein